MTQKKSVLITGASRGIGAAIAEKLLMDGYKVIGTFANSPGRLEKLKASNRDALMIIQADLKKAGDAKRLFDQVMALPDPLYGVVNNAGIMPETPIDSPESVWQQDWADVMQVNVQSVADLCKYAVQYFLDQKTPGQIVNIASRAAFRGDGPDYWHYAASKGAVIALTRTIARAYARRNIHAYTISPGWVRTDMAAVAYEPGNEYMLDEIPLGRAAEAEEVAEMTALLLSGRCNSATGGNFDINGASYVR